MRLFDWCVESAQLYYLYIVFTSIIYHPHDTPCLHCLSAVTLLFSLQNRTSWVLYNMATFYWRIKGEAGQAIECARRALHFSPRLVTLSSSACSCVSLNYSRSHRQISNRSIITARFNRFYWNNELSNEVHY